MKQIFCKFFTKCLEMSKIIPTFVGERIAMVVLGCPTKRLTIFVFVFEDRL